MALPYRVGIIGCGRMGSTIDDELGGHPFTLPYSHAAAYAVVPGATVVAAADPDPARRQAFAARHGVPFGQMYATYQEMLADTPLDIVSVTTPCPAHAAATIAAAQAGVKGIFCEKPIARSLAEADAMIEACDRAGARLMIGHSRRWHPVYQRIAEMIRNGEIGRLTSLSAWFGGALSHTGTHMFDLLRMLAGAEAEWVCARLDGTPGRGDPGGSGYIHFADGVHGFVAGSPGTAHVFDIEVVGSNGIIKTLNNGADLLLWRRTQASRALQPQPFPPIEPKSFTVGAVEDLIQALETGRETRSTGRDGRAALEQVIGFHESHRQGNVRIDLPPSDRSLAVEAY